MSRTRFDPLSALALIRPGRLLMVDPLPRTRQAKPGGHRLVLLGLMASWPWALRAARLEAALLPLAMPPVASQ